MPNLVRRLLDNAANGATMPRPKPADVRPYRRESETGPELVTRTDTHRQTWRQVGWLGQTGAFYSLDEKPHLTEPGSHSPLYFIAHADRLDDLAPPLPHRGDPVEAWLKAQRDQFFRDSVVWIAFDQQLDDYRLHADTGTPLDQHCCEGGNVDDCAGCFDKLLDKSSLGTPAAEVLRRKDAS